MNGKKIFGFFLVFFGLGNFLYASQNFINTNGSIWQCKLLLVYSIIAAIIFALGILFLKKDNTNL